MSTSHRNKQEKATDSSMSTWWIRDVAVPFDGTFDRFLYAVVLFPSQLARTQPFDRNIRQRPTERGWSIVNFGNVLVGHRRLATSQQITTDCVGRGNERIFQKPLPILDWIALDRKNSYPKVSPWRNRELAISSTEYVDCEKSEKENYRIENSCLSCLQIHEMCNEWSTNNTTTTKNESRKKEKSGGEKSRENSVSVYQCKSVESFVCVCVCLLRARLPLREMSTHLV